MIPVRMSSIFCLASSSLPFCSSSSMCNTRAFPRSGDASKCWHTRFKYSNDSSSLKQSKQIKCRCLKLPTKQKLKCTVCRYDPVSTLRITTTQDERFSPVFSHEKFHNAQTDVKRNLGFQRLVKSWKHMFVRTRSPTGTNETLPRLYRTSLLDPDMLRENLTWVSKKLRRSYITVETCRRFTRQKVAKSYYSSCSVSKFFTNDTPLWSELIRVCINNSLRSGINWPALIWVSGAPHLRRILIFKNSPDVLAHSCQSAQKQSGQSMSVIPNGDLSNKGKFLSLIPPCWLSWQHPESSPEISGSPTLNKRWQAAAKLWPVREKKTRKNVVILNVQVLTMLL